MGRVLLMLLLLRLPLDKGQVGGLEGHVFAVAPLDGAGHRVAQLEVLWRHMATEGQLDTKETGK